MFGGAKNALDDLVMIDTVSEDRVMENLKNRYHEDQIYVSGFECAASVGLNGGLCVDVWFCCYVADSVGMNIVRPILELCWWRLTRSKPFPKRIQMRGFESIGTRRLLRFRRMCMRW